MTTVLVTANLNFGRPAAAQRADVRRFKERGAQIICTQEDVRGKHRERVNVTADVKVERSGRPLAAFNRRGMRIGWRRFPWKDCDLYGIGTVRVFSVHMPPLRMRSVLYRPYAWRLRRLLRRSPHPWLVGGDWNHLLRNDPAELTRRFGAKWYGPRIDGWAVHPALVQYVRRYQVALDPRRRDEHPAVYLTLQGTPTVRKKAA